MVPQEELGPVFEALAFRLVEQWLSIGQNPAAISAAAKSIGPKRFVCVVLFVCVVC